MERNPECVLVLRGSSKHLVHVQTSVAVLDIEKLKAIAACDGVTERARKLAARKLEILERDNFECTMCGETRCLTIDHTVPLAKEMALENVEGYVRYRITQLMRSTAEGYPMEKCKTICVWCHGIKDGWLHDMDYRDTKWESGGR